MIRIAALAFTLAFALPAAAQNSSTPTAPALKQNVVVTSDLVRVGDLIENAGDAADIPVFRAPDLGTTGRVSVARIVEAVRVHDVFALDTRGLTDISVTRASRPIDMKDMEARIATAVAARYRVGDPDTLAVTFDREVPILQSEPGLDSELMVSRLSFDPRSGRFDATVELPGSKVIRRGGLRLTGTVSETQETAVLKRAVPRGEILRASDVAIERRPKNDLAADSLSDVQSAIGMSARQQIRAGQALRKSDLTKPEIVQRSQPVTLVFEATGMKLTMRGTAKESGTQGDVINVTNLQSKRSVQGVVTAPGEVTVSTGGTAPRATASLATYQTGLIRRKVQ